MSVEKLDKRTIKEVVRDRYADLVKSGGSSCCSGSYCCSPVDSMKGTLVKEAGYSDEELSDLPKNAVENSYGCGNPLAFSEVEAGQTVLDIGSGAGIDCFLAAQKVGPEGRVIGIDMTQAMIDKATENAHAGGIRNVEFRLGDAEAMPVEDGSVDWVISNCVINLSPDKPMVFSEITRVLKSGGRFSISDIVLGDDLPGYITQNMHAWTGCIAGAINEKEYVIGLEAAGLKEVEVASRIVYDDTVIHGFIKNYIPMGEDRMESIINDISGKLWSAKIVGKK